MGQTKPIRVLVVDDRLDVRSCLATLLRVCDDMRLVGEASDGGAAIELCLRLLPDVVLMDLMMPGVDGISAARAICSSCPGTQIIAMTGLNDQDLAQEALRAGAVACISKHGSAEKLMASIRAAGRSCPD
jgi:DNA-binding NarL/FixJ family response regulator